MTCTTLRCHAPSAGLPIVAMTPIFWPTLAARKATTDAYNTALAKFTEQIRQACQQSLFQSARERVKLASNIQSRDFGERREEERVVVYRRLVDQMLNTVGVTKPAAARSTTFFGSGAVDVRHGQRAVLRRARTGCRASGSRRATRLRPYDLAGL